MSQENVSSSDGETYNSAAWKYFIKGANYKEDPQAQCKQCLKWYKTSGGTSNLFSHLEKKHKIFLKAKKKIAETDNQRKMIFYYSDVPYSKVDVLTAMADSRKALGTWIYQASLPFTIIENPYFRNFIDISLKLKASEPYTHYSADTIQKDIVNFFHSSKDRISDLLKKNNSMIAFTTDMWTSVSRRGYMAITAHWINSEFQLKNLTLSFREVAEKHTGKTIACSFLEVMKEFDLHDKV